VKRAAPRGQTRDDPAEHGCDDSEARGQSPIDRAEDRDTADDRGRGRDRRPGEAVFDAEGGIAGR
jgi:hypothetical protein